MSFAKIFKKFTDIPYISFALLTLRSVSQWMYIESKFNPADDTSCGLSASNQEKVKCWVRGPEFLWNDESSWLNQEDKETLELNEDDPEVKVTVTQYHRF